MPTNDERREVAARLCEMVVSTNPTWPALMEVMGTHTRGGALMEIVNLIEPQERTCHDDYDGRQFRCSECGALIHLLRRDDAFEWELMHPDFCPFCGARVIHDA